MKLDISEEDYNFLKELQNEMLTQNHCGQATPRYWVIRQPEKEYWVEENTDGIFIYDSDICENLFEGDFDSDEFKEWFVDYVNDNFSDIEWNDEELKKGWVECKILGEEYFIYNVDDLKNFLEDNENIYVGYYRINHVIKESTMFITLKDAKEHLKSNGHHYNNEAYIYAMTAWRSPSVKKLYETIEHLKFEED